MEAIYSALILHKAGKEVNEDGIEKILKAAGASVDKNQIKALVAGLSGKNIDEIIAKAAAVPVAAAPAAASAAPAESGKKEAKKEEKKVEEDVGIGGLFD